MTCSVLLESLEKFGRDGDFCGHIGGDDFIVVSTMERAGLISEEAIRLFDARIPDFYEAEDRINGYIESCGRDGHHDRFGVMTISIAIVHNTYRELTHPGKVAQIAAELKCYAKAQEGSIYVYDRRRTG